MKTFEIKLDNSTNKKLLIKLFKEVKNISTLRQDIINGKLACCIVKPNLILDPFQIVIAANKASVAQNQQSLITKTVYSEILFNLSPTKNVTKSLISFGADDKHDTILVAVICDVNDDSYENIFNVIDGVQCDLSELSSFTDVSLIKKTYGANEISNERLLNAVINKIVTKEC